MRLRAYLWKSCGDTDFQTRRLWAWAISFIASLAAVVAGDGAWAAGATAKPNAPNVVFILADDLGWSDTTLYGTTHFYETPNIQRLARRGMLFTQAYAAAPICSPTRASIMTGLHPARLGITVPVCHVENVVLEATLPKGAGPEWKVLQPASVTRLKTDYDTLAKALRTAGYATGHFGKWHLGREPYDPLHQGFDVDVPHWWGPGPAGYIAPWKFPPQLHFTGQPGEHIEDRMAQEAIHFIRQNKHRPFFLNYWAFSVHSPYQAKPRLIEKYVAKADPHDGQHNPLYAAMVQSLDENVGRLMDTLDSLGLADHTIIVFFSDNGGVHFKGFDNEENVYDAPLTSNAPLRGGKGTIYEGGTREPCLVVWPGQVRPGSKSEAVIQSVDFYPTILEMLGLKPRVGQLQDGLSIVPALRESGSLGREAIFCFFPHVTPITGGLPAAYVRQGDWKLIRVFHDGPNMAHRYELYNLKDDVGETTNLAEKMPDKVRQLDILLEDFLVRTHAVVPRPNPNYNPDTKRLDGWRVVRNAKLSIGSGAMVVDATGEGVPVIMSRAGAATGAVTVELRMRSTSSGPVRVFWRRAGEPNFPPPRATTVAFTHDGQWHEAFARMQVEGKLQDIRLDPGSAQGRMELAWIRLKSADGKIIRQWDFRH